MLCGNHNPKQQLPKKNPKHLGCSLDSAQEFLSFLRANLEGILKLCLNFPVAAGSPQWPPVLLQEQLCALTASQIPKSQNPCVFLGSTRSSWPAPPPSQAKTGKKGGKREFSAPGELAELVEALLAPGRSRSINPFPQKVDFQFFTKSVDS